MGLMPYSPDFDPHKETKKHCRGCEDDIHNQGEGGCWFLRDAILIPRKKVRCTAKLGTKNHDNYKPYLSCRTEPGYIFIDKNQRY